MTDEAMTLYVRLGGYDAIAAVAGDLLPRLMPVASETPTQREDLR